MHWHDERINNEATALHTDLVHSIVLIDLLRRMRDDYERALLNQRAETIALAQRVMGLEAQLAAAHATIERACVAPEANAGARYAEGCAP